MRHGTWFAAVRAMLEKQRAETKSDAVAYGHPGCHRTSNELNPPMDRLYRLMYAGHSLHGHQGSLELRPRGWALPMNFCSLPSSEQPPPRSRQPRPSAQRQALPRALASQPEGVYLADGLQSPRARNPVESGKFIQKP